MCSMANHFVHIIITKRMTRFALQLYADNPSKGLARFLIQATGTIPNTSHASTPDTHARLDWKNIGKSMAGCSVTNMFTPLEAPMMAIAITGMTLVLKI